MTSVMIGGIDATNLQSVALHEQFDFKHVGTWPRQGKNREKAQLSLRAIECKSITQLDAGTFVGAAFGQADHAVSADPPLLRWSPAQKRDQFAAFVPGRCDWGAPVDQRTKAELL